MQVESKKRSRAESDPVNKRLKYEQTTTTTTTNAIVALQTTTTTNTLAIDIEVPQTHLVPEVPNTSLDVQALATSFMSLYTTYFKADPPLLEVNLSGLLLPDAILTIENSSLSSLEKTGGSVEIIKKIIELKKISEFKLTSTHGIKIPLGVLVVCTGELNFRNVIKVIFTQEFQLKQIGSDWVVAEIKFITK